MILEILDHAGRPLRLPTARLVVFADDGCTPLAAAVEHTPGGFIEVSQAFEDADGRLRPNPNFARMLHTLGLARSRILTRAPLRALGDFNFEAR